MSKDFYRASNIIMDDPKESIADTSIAMSNHIERFEDFDMDDSQNEKN